jgi:hypothetical protein
MNFNETADCRWDNIIQPGFYKWTTKETLKESNNEYRPSGLFFSLRLNFN